MACGLHTKYVKISSSDQVKQMIMEGGTRLIVNINDLRAFDAEVRCQSWAIIITHGTRSILISREVFLRALSLFKYSLLLLYCQLIYPSSSNTSSNFLTIISIKLNRKLEIFYASPSSL